MRLNHNTLINITSVILIIIIGLSVYFNSLFNGFVWDDEAQIQENSVIQNLNNIRLIFSGATFTTGGGALSGWFFRPLLTFTFMLNFLFFGASPLGYHLFQVIFHILNAVLIFKILNRLGEGVGKPIPLFISILFVIHPAATEAVAYISALGEVMYTFFALSAFYLLVKAVRVSWKGFLLVTMLLFISLLYKESALSIFPVIATFLFIFRHPYWKRISLSLIISSLAYFLVRLVIIKTPIRSPQFAPISEASIQERLLTLPSVFVSYLKIFFFPKDLATSQHFLVKAPTLEFFIPLGISIIFFITIIVLLKISKSKLLLLGFFWFLLSFAFISNLIPLDMTIAERWLYFPSIGFLFILAGILEYLKPRKVSPCEADSKAFIFTIIILFLITPLLSIRTVLRNRNWQDGLTLYSHDIQISRNSFDLENNLGVELVRAGKFPEAKKHFERSISLQPKWHFAYNNLGVVYEREGNPAKAKELYLKTLEMSDYYLAYENAAFLILREGNAKEAKDFTEKALSKLPNNPKLWLTLAVSHYKLGAKNQALLAARQSVLLAPSELNYYVLDRLTQDKPLELEGFK